MENYTPKTKKSTQANRLFKSVLELEKESRNIIASSGLVSEEAKKIRVRIRDKYLEIILSDLVYAHSKDVEGKLWKSAFYREFEEYRKMLKAFSESDIKSKKKSFRTVRSAFRKALREAIEFYTKLKANIAERYRIQHYNSYHCLDGKTNSGAENITEKARLSYFRCLIYLGDLARYYEMQSNRVVRNWDVAVNYYREALDCNPDNGNSHNQLAVIHTYSGDNLSAIYHYFRSLATLEPFPTSKDNVSLLFNKALKSYLKRSNTENSKPLNESNLDRLFENFIILHGLAFMKSGHISTAFEGVKSLFVIDLKDCIESRSLSPDRILKLTVINIIGLHLSRTSELQTKRTWTGALKKKGESVEYYLFFLNIEMFIALLSASNKSWKTNPLHAPFCIRRTLPSLRIGIRWLINDLDTFTHVIDRFSDEEAETLEEFFQQWDEFLYHAENSLRLERSENARSVLLREDIEVRGFRPLEVEYDVLLQDLAKIPPLVELQNRISEFIARKQQFSKFESSQYWGIFFKSYSPFPCMRFLNQDGQESTTEEEISSGKSSHKKRRISCDSSPESADVRHRKSPELIVQRNSLPTDAYKSPSNSTSSYGNDEQLAQVTGNAFNVWDHFGCSPIFENRNSIDFHSFNRSVDRLNEDDSWEEGVFPLLDEFPSGE